MVTDQTMSDIRRAALAMGPLIREQADEIERQRRLTPPVVEAMKQAGVYAMSMPKAWGGLELDLPEQLRVIETLARFDGSVGWCAEMSTTNGYISSWFSDGAGKELFRDASSAWAGSILFSGQAVRSDGGYNVSGRWPFASACHQADVFGFACGVTDSNDARVIRPEGFPELRFCLLPASQGKILDTWYTTGLRGTGSHDFELKDVYVPESHTTLYPDVKPQRHGPLYNYPFTFLYLFCANALGIAQHAIDAFVEIANQREITIAALVGQKALLRMSPHAQVAVSQAEGLVRSSRCLVYEVVDEIWAALLRGEIPSMALRAAHASAMTHTYRACTQAVDLLYKANGGSSVYARSPLERCFRDIHTGSQHHLASLAFDEKAGQVMLGLEPVDQMF
jgi:alkylation response protein AidB-like acyl-CoA dehydrogenase